MSYTLSAIVESIMPIIKDSRNRKAFPRQHEEADDSSRELFDVGNTSRDSLEEELTWEHDLSEEDEILQQEQDQIWWRYISIIGAIIAALFFLWDIVPTFFEPEFDLDISAQEFIDDPAFWAEKDEAMIFDPFAPVQRQKPEIINDATAAVSIAGEYSVTDRFWGINKGDRYWGTSKRIEFMRLDRPFILTYAFRPDQSFSIAVKDEADAQGTFTIERISFSDIVPLDRPLFLNLEDRAISSLYRLILSFDEHFDFSGGGMGIFTGEHAQKDNTWTELIISKIGDSDIIFYIPNYHHTETIELVR